MVKKLLKHELIYYFRSFGLFLPIVLVIAVMARVFQCFDDSYIINQIIISSSSGMLLVSCAALLVLSSVAGIVRFYKNMFSAEGYLTFTLPVTNAEHIFVKLVAAMICEFVCLLVVLVAAAISLSGEEYTLFWQRIRYITGMLAENIGPVHMIGYTLEWVLLVLLSLASTMLLIYSCIAIGQTAKKNRIIKAIGAYFVYYIITQVVSTIVTITIMVLAMSNSLNGILQWVAFHPYATLHMGFCGMILLLTGLSAAFWAITQHIMSKKLNLE